MSAKFIDVSTLTGAHLPPAKGWLQLFGSPETFATMQVEHTDQILFLDRGSTTAVYDAFNKRDLLCGADAWGNHPFVGDCFHSVERHHVGDEAVLKKWLFARGIPFAVSALVLPAFGAENEPAVLTTWKMVVKYSARIFRRTDLAMVDVNADWCLYYRQNEIAFAKEPNTAKTLWPR